MGCRLCFAGASTYIIPLPLRIAVTTLSVTLGICPFATQPLTGSFFTFAPRQRTQAHTESQKQQLQRAGHEPVCLVPGSVDKYLCVPECPLQQSHSTHILRAFYFADIGITTDKSSNISCTCVVLALVAGRRDCQPCLHSQQQTPLLLSQQLLSQQIYSP